MQEVNNIKFEFFKKWNYHFLPLFGSDITVEQATAMAKAGGSCGGPYYPVRQSASPSSLKFEVEAKRIAHKFGAEFTIMNQLPPHSPWWKKNEAYLRWMNYKARKLIRKYGVDHKPALVVRINDKHMIVYDDRDLEKNINKFKVQAL
jgi:hypothetical protein